MCVKKVTTKQTNLLKETLQSLVTFQVETQVPRQLMWFQSILKAKWYSLVSTLSCDILSYNSGLAIFAIRILTKVKKNDLGAFYKKLGFVVCSIHVPDVMYLASTKPSGLSYPRIDWKLIEFRPLIKIHAFLEWKGLVGECCSTNHMSGELAAQASYLR